MLYPFNTLTHILHFNLVGPAVFVISWAIWKLIAEESANINKVCIAFVLYWDSLSNCKLVIICLWIENEKTSICKQIITMFTLIYLSVKHSFKSYSKLKCRHFRFYLLLNSLPLLFLLNKIFWKYLIEIFD